MANSHKKRSDNKRKSIAGGGNLVGHGNKKPSTDGTRGGYAVGDLHSDPSGGISARVGSKGNPILFQGGEAVITAPALSDPTLHEFEGKKMTKRQVLSAINVDAGGVSFAEGGKIKNKMKVRYCSKQYKFGGKMMSGKDIVNDCGCQHKMAKGGKVQAGGVVNQKLLKDLSEVKLPSGYDYIKGHPEELLRYVQEQATGIDHTRQHVNTNFRGNTLSRMVGRDLVIRCVAALPQVDKDKIIKAWKGLALDPDIRRELRKKSMASGGTTGPVLGFNEFKSKYNQIYRYNNAKGKREWQLSIHADDRPGLHTFYSLKETRDDAYKDIYEAYKVWVSKGSKMAGGGGVNQQNSLVVICKSAGNPDFGQDENLPISDEEKIPVNTLGEAAKECLDYIKHWNLGGGNWTGGEVYDVNGKIVAYVSYNGSVWNKEPYHDDNSAKKITGPELSRKWYEDGGTLNRKTISVPDLTHAVGNSRQYQHYKRGGHLKPYPDFSNELPPVITEKGGTLKDDSIESLRPSQRSIRQIELKLTTRKDVPDITFNVPADIYDYLWSIWNRDSLNIQESFFVLYMSRANKLIGYQELSKGGVTGTVADPELIVATAAKAIAKSVVIAHNHPSGSLKPSRADEEMTTKIGRALGYIDCKLLDHIILTPEKGEYYSFSDQGLLSYARGGKLKKSDLTKNRSALIPLKGEEMTASQFASNLQKMRKFVPSFQVEALMQIYRGEEKDYAVEIMQRLLHTFETMPKTYQTEKQETNDKTIYLHYFYGGMDWYIVEKDSEPAQYQAFGYANLGDNPQGGEWGYISLVELMQTNKIEIDFNWTPITFGQLTGKSIKSDDVSTGGPTDDQRWLKILQKYPDKSVVARLTKYKQKVYDENENDNNHTENLVLLAKATENGELIEVAELILSEQEKLGHFPSDYGELRNRISDIIRIEREDSHATIPEIAAANPGRIIIAKAASSAPATKQQSSTTTKQQGNINEQIRKLVKNKGDDRSKYSADEIALLKLYEGAGAEKETSTDVRILDQFFTHMDIVAKMWGMVIKHGFTFKKTNVLEPSVGSGRFLQYIPLPSKDVIVSVDAYDVDETCVKICKVLYPFFSIHHDSFESLFFRDRTHIGLAGVTKFYDLVIGNPPYREYVSEYAPLGEKKATGAFTFEMYFISRGIDVLKKGGLLCYIIPNTFLSNDNKYNEFKEKLAKKADLIDAYRLPNGVFGNTDVGTDIILLKKK